VVFFIFGPREVETFDPFEDGTPQGAAMQGHPRDWFKAQKWDP